MKLQRTPKAKGALDKEWENLRTKGVWDEPRVRQCKSIVDEARQSGQTVHLGRILEACYEKGSELPPDDPRRKFKGRTVFQGNNVRDQDSDHALFAELGSSPASMEAAKLLDAFGSQPGFSKAQAMPFRHISRPSGMAFTSKKPMARTLEQRVLATHGSFVFSTSWTS